VRAVLDFLVDELGADPRFGRKRNAAAH
jgi:hypothetical protein